MNPFGPFNAAALFNLKGWVAVVTDGGTGIGLMATKALAANGAKVYITGRRFNVLETTIKEVSTPDLLGDAGGSIVPLQMDVTDKVSITKVVEEIGEKEKWVNLLINNAGISLSKADVSSAAKGPEAFRDGLFNDDPAQWAQTFETNVTANFFVASAFIPLLVKAKEPPSQRAENIINVSSLSGLPRCSQNGQFSYNASKSANAHLSRMMAHEFSHPNIMVRVNTISPGYFPSQMCGDPTCHLTGQGFRAESSVPADRYGWETEMAKAVLALATNEYMWGSEMLVDGGLLSALP
ncbi:hypothetical protein M231_06786 [Tremella mesenterica]|uniref:Short-chain dehydrogenase n=1 Tax=Tremella mesenterica TaxID=5217 RepID=A0A4Q1BG59_TREME|nr:hypothetical protein M231_06786 [Tremella mesenterica]